MVKTAHKHQDRKMELVRVAERLFLDRGYEQTSIEDILQASGISKGGFYHYFSSKEAVLVESISDFSDRLLTELVPVIDDPAVPAMEKLNWLLARKQVAQHENRDLVRYLLMVMQSDFTLHKFTMTVAHKYVEPLARIIAQGTAEGVFRVEYPRETADILLRAITSVPQSLFFAAYTGDANRSAQYKAALESIVSRSLGLEGQRLHLFADDSADQV